MNIYTEVSFHGVVRLTQFPGAGLSQAAMVDNPVAGHEIVVIVGSPSKVAKGTLIEFATKLTQHTRVSQGWSGAHVIVEPMKFRELPTLGQPRREFWPANLDFLHDRPIVEFGRKRRNATAP